jgi:hypothetical protein
MGFYCLIASPHGINPLSKPRTTHEIHNPSQLYSEVRRQKTIDIVASPRTYNCHKALAYAITLIFSESALDSSRLHARPHPQHSHILTFVLITPHALILRWSRSFPRPTPYSDRLVFHSRLHIAFMHSTQSPWTSTTVSYLKTPTLSCTHRDRSPPLQHHPIEYVPQLGRSSNSLGTRHHLPLRANFSLTTIIHTMISIMTTDSGVGNSLRIF